jgi:hypothetical protein
MGCTRQFRFAAGVSVANAEMTLHLAMFAVEGLIGRVAVHLDARYLVDLDGNAIAIDGRTLAGQLLIRIYAGLLLREIGEAAFEIV